MNTPNLGAGGAIRRARRRRPHLPHPADIAAIVFIVLIVGAAAVAFGEMVGHALRALSRWAGAS
jgi:hypothetical protein